MWNWNKFTICDDMVFIASCINEVVGDEVQWLSQKEQVIFVQHMFKFVCCIERINGILIKIHRPQNNLIHQSWFDEHKKMYYMNNIVAIDHCGLFIYLDLGYLGSFDNVNILRE